MNELSLRTQKEREKEGESEVQRNEGLFSEKDMKPVRLFMFCKYNSWLIESTWVLIPASASSVLQWHMLRALWKITL